MAYCVLVWCCRLVAARYDDELALWGGEHCRMVESKHPYDDSQIWMLVEEVVFEGAAEIAIAFDERCATEQGYDFVTLYTSPSRTELLPGTERYTGRRGSGNYRTTKNPIVHRGDRVSVFFTSDSSSNDWGFRICLRPSYDQRKAGPTAASPAAAPSTTTSQSPQQALPQEQSQLTMWERHEANKAASSEVQAVRHFFARALYYASLSESVRTPLTFDTPRGADNTYLPNTVYARSMTFPGAECVEVEFDVQSETEFLTDRLQLFRPPAEGRALSSLGESDLLTYTAAGKEYKAVFHGAYSEHPPSGKAGADQNTSGWPKCSLSTDRLLAHFASNGVRGFWGARFVCTPQFPRVFSQGSRFSLVQQECVKEDVFALLRERALTRTPHPFFWLREAEEAIDCYCGLVLANALTEPKARGTLLSAYGSEWLTRLLQDGPVDVQLRLLSGLQAVPLASAKGPVSEELRRQLLAAAVQKLGSSQDEVQALALALLRGGLGGEASGLDMEGVLMECVGPAQDPSLQKEALDRITAIASQPDSASLARLISLGVVDRVKPIIQSADQSLKVAALGAIRRLLRTEEAILDFLDDNGRGFDFVADFLLSDSKDSQLVGLDLTTLMLSKAESEAAIMAHSASSAAALAAPLSPAKPTREPAPLVSQKRR